MMIAKPNRERSVTVTKKGKSFARTMKNLHPITRIREVFLSFVSVPARVPDPSSSLFFCSSLIIHRSSLFLS